MNLAYVAQDGIDIAEVVKQELVMTYPRQMSDVSLPVHVDSDWVGDLLGRLNTGVTVRRGKHLLRHMSCLPTLVALSSGETEYYALIREATKIG